MEVSTKMLLKTEIRVFGNILELVYLKTARDKIPIFTAEQSECDLNYANIKPIRD